MPTKQSPSDLNKPYNNFCYFHKNSYSHRFFSKSYSNHKYSRYRFWQLNLSFRFSCWQVNSSCWLLNLLLWHKNSSIKRLAAGVNTKTRCSSCVIILSKYNWCKQLFKRLIILLLQLHQQHSLLYYAISNWAWSLANKLINWVGN